MSSARAVRRASRAAARWLLIYDRRKNPPVAYHYNWRTKEVRLAETNAEEGNVVTEADVEDLATLRDAVKDGTEQDCIEALSSLKLMSIEDANRTRMGAESLGLLEVLRDVVTGGTEEARVQALRLVGSLTCDKANSARMGAEALGLLEVLRDVVRGGTEEARLKALMPLWNIAEDGDALTAARLLVANVHEAIADVIKAAGDDAATWDESVHHSMNFTMNLARHSVSVQPLKDLGMDKTVQSIFLRESNSAECLKAMMIVVFLEGKSEFKEGSTNIIQSRPEIILQLANIYSDTLDSNEVSEFPLGTFCLKLLINACLVLSISDTNKAALVKAGIVPLLARSVDSFLQRAPEVRNCGGGGEDYVSAELAIATLLNLSFLYDDAETLRRHFVTKAFNIEASVRELLIQERLSGEAVNTLLLLCARFDEVSPRSRALSVEPAEVAAARPAHIMVSYCWSKTSQPELVHLLASKLSTMGLDVWRDETGSTLVPPMSGGVDERMAEALDASSLVIICVSADYKERPNCRMEAKYANQLKKKGKTQLIFVMMNENYTTFSTPDSCDGWLGLMIGDEMWYPLWSPKMVDDTAGKVARAMVDKTRPLLSNRGRLPQAPSSPFSITPATSHSAVSSFSSKPSASDASASPQHPSSTASTASTAATDFKAVYDILLEPKSSLDDTAHSTLLNTLDEIGCLCLEDLSSMEAADFRPLARLLKPLRRKRMLALLGLAEDKEE